jgi:tetratricopeptide (TPR) repeat protein
MNDKNKKIAEKLHQKAIKLDDEGKIADAINLYNEALTYDPNRSTTYYNLGLIYKYKCEWELSFEFNRKALEIKPDDEASIWNFAIAATALKKWDVARNAWIKYGIKLKSNEGPVEEDFGITPIRLNPFTEGEVVWARRICPARAKIESIPLPESGFQYADIVLHDGALLGHVSLTTLNIACLTHFPFMKDQNLKHIQVKLLHRQKTLCFN